MYGEIALLANQIHFCHDARPDQLLESWLGEKADQVVLVGSFERGIRPMKPGDQRLIGSPCVEDRRPWIAVGVMPGSLRFFRSARPSRARRRSCPSDSLPKLSPDQWDRLSYRRATCEILILDSRRAGQLFVVGHHVGHAKTVADRLLGCNRWGWSTLRVAHRAVFPPAIWFDVSSCDVCDIDG